MVDGLKIAWRYVEKLLRFIGKVQSTLLLLLSYYLVVGPVAMVWRGAQMFKSKRSQTSFWIPRSREEESEETLRRQF